jgi:hypothetical protein
MPRLVRNTLYAARVSALVLLLGIGVVVRPGKAATASFATPALDRWMYGNVPGSYGGTRDVAPVFATLNSPDEDRLGTMLIGFNTAALIPPGLGAASYLVTSVRLRVTVSEGDTFLYDPTYDSYRTYLPITDPNHLADADSGRPLELFGVGLRNGYTSLSASIAGAQPHQFHEISPYGPSGVHGKNAYPLGFTNLGGGIDVADSVSEAFEALPFALGVASGLTPGVPVPGGTEFTFNLNLSHAGVLAYVQAALDGGILGLNLTSLHSATGQTGPQTYPIFYTRENLLGDDFAPKLEIIYTVIPEPRVSTLLILAAGIFAAGRACRHRDHLT